MSDKMKFFFKDDEDDNVRVFKDFIEFLDEFDITLRASDEWCYLCNLQNVENLPDEMEVVEFFTRLVHNAKPLNLSSGAVIQFSVTSKEVRCDEWLEAVGSIPAASITTSHRYPKSKDHYYVYLCSFPVDPEI